MSATRWPGADLVFLDFEGTGTDPHSERIVEATFFRLGEEPFTTRINPGIPIPPEATAVHGITDEDVRHAPSFAMLAPRIQALIAGATLVGYNLRRYDTVILDAELRRARQPGLPRGEDGRLCIPEIDLYQIWMRSEPRTLAGAAKRFAGVELGEDAHSAEADTLVLPQVLEGMLRTFELVDISLEDLCALCVPDGEVDRDGKFRRREDRVVIFNFSNKRGSPAHDDPGLLHWMLGKDFSAETKALARALLDEIYGRPARGAEAPKQEAFL